MEEKVIKPAPKEAKMSYEQLENVAHQMSEQSRNLYTQNQQLSKALEEAQMYNFFKKLDYLWSVIHSDSVYLSREFKIKCGEEFMEALSSKEEEKSEE